MPDFILDEAVLPAAKIAGNDPRPDIPSSQKITDVDFNLIRQSLLDVRTHHRAVADNVVSGSALIQAANTAAASAVSAAQAAQEEAAIITAALADISSDNKLTSGEKLSVILEVKSLLNEKPALDTQADAYGVSHTTYDASVDALSSYIGVLGLTLGINEASWLATTSDISGSAFRAVFTTVYAARQDLLNAVAEASKTASDSALSSANLAATVAAAASSAASAAQTLANSANAALADISSDNKLTPAEKLAVLVNYKDLWGAKASIDSQADAFSVSRSAYDVALSDLNAYMVSLGLTLGTNDDTWLATTTNIVGSALRGAFATAYSARQTILNSISAAVKIIADGAVTTANSASSVAAAASFAANAAQNSANIAISALTDIASDSKLTPAEKLSVLVTYKDLWNGKAGLDTQADTFGVSRVAYDTALSALNTYMVSLGLTLGSNDATWVGSTTDIVGATFRSTFSSAYTERQNLLNAIASVAKSTADSALSAASAASAVASAAATAASSALTSASTANSALADISSDNKLTPGEKLSVLVNYKDLWAAKSGLDTQADTFGVARATYDTAVTALNTYMVSLGLTLGVNDATWLASTTDVVGATLRTNFATAYTERQNLLNAISLKAKQLADAAATSQGTVTIFAGVAPTVRPAEVGGGSLHIGDLWFNSGSFFQPSRWDGTAWILVHDAAPILASQITAGLITAAMVAADTFKTSNYAEDGSGNPTAGAKLDHVGTALKVAPGNLQIGDQVYQNLWFAGSQAAAVTIKVFTDTPIPAPVSGFPASPNQYPVIVSGSGYNIQSLEPILLYPPLGWSNPRPDPGVTSYNRRFRTRVNFATPMPDTGYIVQLSKFNTDDNMPYAFDFRVSYKTVNGFDISIGQYDSSYGGIFKFLTMWTGQNGNNISGYYISSVVDAWGNSAYYYQSCLEYAFDIVVLRRAA